MKIKVFCNVLYCIEVEADSTDQAFDLALNTDLADMTWVDTTFEEDYFEDAETGKEI